VILAIFLYFFRYAIAEVYTGIPDLSEEVAHVLSFYAVYHLLDGNKSICCGVMRGLSKQSPAAVVSMISYYVIAFPVQLLFGFKLGLEVIGLWMGQMCGALFHLVALLYLIIVSYDWKLIALEA
jgi:MATE family multidrug resistance protein